MLTLLPMTKKHLNDVAKIEKDCFSVPWSKKALEDEITKNDFAIYFVACEDNKVIGYGGMWHVVNEGHITNIAVKKEYRRKGVAAAIINKITETAIEKDMIGLTLEVRTSNSAAIALYKKFGFKLEGIRKEYYSDTKEDALVMWKYLIPEELIINN